jgi:hypothetical protein
MLAQRCPVGTVRASGGSAVESDLLARRREGPGNLHPALLAKREAHLPRRPQALRAVGPEGRARAGLCDRAEHVLTEEAALA